MSVFNGLRKLFKGMMKSDTARQANGNLGDAVAKQQVAKRKEIYTEAGAKAKVAQAESNISHSVENDKGVASEVIAKQKAEVEVTTAHDNVISQGKVLDTLERIKTGDINNLDPGVLKQVLSSDVGVEIKDEIEGAGEMMEAVKDEEIMAQDEEERDEEKSKEKKKMQAAAEAEFAQENAETTTGSAGSEESLTGGLVTGSGETDPSVADTPTVPASAAMPLPGMGGPTPPANTPEKPEEINK